VDTRTAKPSSCDACQVTARSPWTSCGPGTTAVLPARLSGAYAIGLYVDGRAFTSEALATHLGSLLQRGQSNLVFAVGGADGLPAAVGDQVRERWSLSPLTFSHGLARLLLLEALYRSFDILHGGRYHK
jgi:23S rRNA (pseudouridine1915-N3)-methyltransferase